MYGGEDTLRSDFEDCPEKCTRGKIGIVDSHSIEVAIIGQRQSVSWSLSAIEVESVQDFEFVRGCDLEYGSRIKAAVVLGCAEEIPVGILHDRGRIETGIAVG